MSARDRKTKLIVGVGMMLALLALIWPFLGVPRGFSIGVILLYSIAIFLMVMARLGARRSSSGETQAAEPMADPATSPDYYEETPPEDIESETPELSCPDCGCKNPEDAAFCIRCGQDLDITDDVARY